MSHAANREAVERMPAYPDDWLLLAGDVTHGLDAFAKGLELLASKFKQVVWAPGNHELWTADGSAGELRGEPLYHSLVAVARDHGVMTPLDPYPVFPHPSGDILIAPLFLLYDYSFRPDHVRADEVVRWAREQRSVCADEYWLPSDPFRNRGSWCAALCEEASARLAACPRDIPKVLVNHYPLEEERAVLPGVPRLSPWCGTRRTRGWHTRFNACAVVYGHLHVRGTWWLDGVPFQEVSLGYPRDWDPQQGVSTYLREVKVATPRNASV